MGFRIHQRTVSKIKYDDGLFNHEIEELADFISEYCEDDFIFDETGYPRDHWELSTDNIKNAISDIKTKYKPDEIIFTDWTAQELSDTFEHWLNVNEKNKDNLDSPNLIILDWF